MASESSDRPDQTTDLAWATRVLGTWAAFAHSVTDETVYYKLECSDIERSMTREEWCALPIFSLGGIGLGQWS